MRILALCCAIAALALFAGCGDSKPSAQEFFLTYLNLDAVPASVSEFQTQELNRFPAFLSKGYFTYKASPEYFEVLGQADRSRSRNAVNRAIRQVDCASLPDDFSLWTNATINKQGKECFEGVIDLTRHLVLYDATSNQVWHFLQAIRN